MHRSKSIKRIKNGGGMANKIYRSLKRSIFGTKPNPLTKGKSSHNVNPSSNNKYEWVAVKKQLSDNAEKAETQRVIEHSVDLFINSNNAADSNDIYKFITTDRLTFIPFLVTKTDPYFKSAHWVNIKKTRNFSNMITSNAAKKAKKASNKAARNVASNKYRASLRKAMNSPPSHREFPQTRRTSKSKTP
jgi:hypothetical protein